DNSFSTAFKNAFGEASAINGNLDSKDFHTIGSSDFKNSDIILSTQLLALIGKSKFNSQPRIDVNIRDCTTPSLSHSEYSLVLPKKEAIYRWSGSNSKAGLISDKTSNVVLDNISKSALVKYIE